MADNFGSLPIAGNYDLVEDWLKAQQAAQLKQQEQDSSRQWDMQKMQMQNQMDFQKQAQLQALQNQPKGIEGGLANVLRSHQQQAYQEDPFYNVGNYIKQNPYQLDDDASPWAKLAVGLGQQFVGGLASSYGESQAQESYRNDPTIKTLTSAFQSDNPSAMLMQDPELQQYGLQLAMERAKSQYEQQGKLDLATAPKGFLVRDGAMQGFDTGGGFTSDMTKDQWSQEDTLRKEYLGSQIVKDMQTVEPLFQQMVKAAQTKGGMSDLAMVTHLAKIFDPQSVVREAEGRMILESQSMPDQIRSWFERAATGQGLSADVRTEMVQVAAQKRNEYLSSLQQMRGEYEGIASRRNANFENVDVFGQDLKPWEMTPGFKPVSAGGAPSQSSGTNKTGLTVQTVPRPTTPGNPTNQLQAGKNVDPKSLPSDEKRQWIINNLSTSRGNRG